MEKELELNINNLTKCYGNNIALNHFSLDMKTGIYGLLGANGAGKTTLMRLICKILEPSEGEIKLNGYNICNLGENYRKMLGYLPQDFGYYPDFTAMDYLLYIASLKGIKDNKAKEKTIELLELVGLQQVKNKKIKTFSGGMKQRLGIAQAVLNDPEILILDEPTAGLDPKERVRFRKLIASFAQDKIVLLSTHIVSDVEYIADEIVLLKKGQVLQKDTVENLVNKINGWVWECEVSADCVEKFSENKCIVNIKSNEKSELLRIVSREKPAENANLVTPTLEDVYLYCFGNEDNI
ncbi:MAG: ABC transporter ATP-binding protein [Oscillospiraceae bacterium]